MPELIYKEEVYTIVGAAMEVYNVLGSGFLEAVYQEALELELMYREIPFESQKELHISYKEQFLRKTYIADFVVLGKVIVEIKALNLLTTLEQAQLLNYLKVTGFKVGVLLNFGAEGKLEWKRMAKTQTSHRP